MRANNLATGLLACLALSAVAAEPAPPPSAAPPGVTLADVDATLDGLKRMIWDLSGSMREVTDDSGRRFEDDLAEFVLTDETLARIEALRAKLPEARIPGSDRIDLVATLPLREIVTRETCKIGMLSVYWGENSPASTYVANIEDMLQRLPDARREQFTADMQAIRESPRRDRSILVEDIEACQSAAEPFVAMAERIARVMSGYEALQSRILSATEAAILAGEIEPTRRQRSTPCPPPAVPTPGDSRIRLLKPVNPVDYYPPAARNLGLEGKAKVEAGYDSGGCIQEVGILQTTGNTMLDEAAMRMVFDMQLVPATEEGKPVAGRVAIPVGFSLRAEEPPE